MADKFWAAIDAQITELELAKTADEVIEICNRYSPPSSGDAFFAGSGGDKQVIDALSDAGWRFAWIKATYYWGAYAPIDSDGSAIHYVEGDIYRGIGRPL